MKRYKILSATLAFLLAVLTLPLPVSAAGSAGFSVKPVLPDNQNPDTSGFFDLKVSPGQVQELEITIINQYEREMEVTVETVTASTNQNGVINYTTPGQMDETLQYDFTDMTTVRENRLTVPGRSSINTSVLLEVPEEPFAGTVLGSIQILKALTEEELASGEMIVNQYSFVVGVRLQHWDKGELQPDFDLGEVEADLTNYRASVVNQIRNTQPMLIKGMDVSVSIQAKNSGKVVFERDMYQVDMAPNSIFPMVLTDQAGYGIQAGTYLSKVHLEYRGQTWDFEKEFEVEAQQAANINQNALNQDTRQTAMQPGGMPLWAMIAMMIGAALLILVLILLIVLLKRQMPAK